MSSKYVRDQFRASWSTLIPDIPLIETLNENPDHETMPDIWCTVDFYGPNEYAVSLGEPSCRRESGAIEVTINVPSGTSDENMLTAAETIRNAYRYWKVDGINITQVDPPVPDGQSSNGLWYLAGVDISYDYDNFI